jgi:hypothetical protein
MTPWEIRSDFNVKVKLTLMQEISSNKILATNVACVNVMHWISISF